MQDWELFLAYHIILSNLRWLRQYNLQLRLHFMAFSWCGESLHIPDAIRAEYRASEDR